MRQEATQMKIEFEKWAMGRLHLSKNPDSSKTYLFRTTEAAWQAWQEASRQSPAVVDAPITRPAEVE